MTNQELVRWAYGFDAVNYADFAAKFAAANPGAPVPTKAAVVAQLQTYQRQALRDSLDDIGLPESLLAIAAGLNALKGVATLPPVTLNWLTKVQAATQKAPAVTDL